jgi:hypothetical protein
MSSSAILEISESTKKEIVKLIDSKDSFLDYIKSKIKEYILIENLSYDDFCKNKTFKCGKYLLLNDNKAVYVEKENVISEGKLYNSTKLNFKILTEWEMIPIIVDLKEFIKEKYEGFENEEELMNAKLDMLIKLCQLVNMGIKLSQNYTIESNYKIMKYEYELHNKIIEEQLEQIEKESKEEDSTNSYSSFDVNDYEQMTNIDFPEFTSIYMIGIKRAEQSMAICNILSKYTDEFIRNTLIISHHERLHPIYKYKYPITRIETQYRSELLQEYLKTDAPGAIILDDCLNHDFDWEKDEVFQDLLFNYKSYNKLLIITTQVPTKFEMIRKAMDYIFLFSENLDKKELFHYLIDMFVSYDSFRNMFKGMTQDHNCMVLNMKWRENFDERICWFNTKLKEKTD